MDTTRTGASKIDRHRRQETTPGQPDRAIGITDALPIHFPAVRITGFLVGSKDSGWPTPESQLAIWLQAHIMSLTLTGDAVDEPGLEAAYRDRHRDGDEDQ